MNHCMIVPQELAKPPQNPQPIAELTRGEGKSDSVAFSPDGRFASGFDKFNISLWDEEQISKFNIILTELLTQSSYNGKYLAVQHVRNGYYRQKQSQGSYYF